MNRLEIRTLVRKKLGETTGSFWSDTEINTYINLGCGDVAERTHCLRRTGYLTTSEVVANPTATIESQWELQANFPNFLSVIEAHFHENGKTWQKLEPRFKTDLDRDYEGWRDAVGREIAAPQTYNYECVPSIPFTYWWDYEEDLIGIYPPCDQYNATSNNFQVLYSYDSTDITSDNDSPEVPRPLHLGVVEFAVATGFETRGLQDKANDSWDKYFKNLEDYHINKWKGREDDEIISKNVRN